MKASLRWLMRHGRQPWAILVLAAVASVDSLLPMMPAEVLAVATQPIVEPETLTLDQAKAIVNDAVQPAAPGRQSDQLIRPPLDLLTAAKAVVNAAVQPKAPV